MDNSFNTPSSVNCPHSDYRNMLTSDNSTCVCCLTDSYSPMSTEEEEAWRQNWLNIPLFRRIFQPAASRSPEARQLLRRPYDLVFPFACPGSVRHPVHPHCYWRMWLVGEEGAASHVLYGRARPPLFACPICRAPPIHPDLRSRTPEEWAE